ncbi:flagellar hook basal-body protein [bacterium]|nr:flagellar hook basal-body protein [bacterium]
MTGGMRVAGNAMSNFATRHDVISNNLANVSTPGFARQDTFVRRSETVAAQPFEVPEVTTRTDFRAGAPILTGNPLDLALEGSGFFTVLTPDGEERFTRVASLRPDADGFLRDGSGNALLGENGVLHVGDADLLVEKDGTVVVGDSFLDRLRITTFASGDAVRRDAGGLYEKRDGFSPDTAMARPEVHTGQLEGSAVEPVPELVRMIQAMRSYEAAASALKATDSTLDRAVNDIARV